jgi:hypothetical protein
MDWWSVMEFVAEGVFCIVLVAVGTLLLFATLIAIMNLLRRLDL